MNTIYHNSLSSDIFEVTQNHDVVIRTAVDVFKPPFFRYSKSYLSYRYSIDDVAKMLGKDSSTIRQHVIDGKLKINFNRKTSLYHISKYLLNTRQKRSSCNRWTQNEIDILLAGKIPPGRNNNACKIMRSRLKGNPI